MIKNLEIGNINKFKRYIPLDVNNSSKIYYEKGCLHKIPDYVYKNLKETIEYIEDNNIKWTVKVTNFITDKNKIVGYTMKKYDDYKSLAKNKSRNIDLKLQDCQKLIKVFQYFNNKNLIYSDFHTGNFLLNKETNDIKVCDLDNFTICKYKDAKNNQLSQAIKLCVSYIYNIYPDEADIVVNRSPINIDSNNYIRDCLKSIDKKDFNQKVKRLKKIDKNALVNDRKRIKEEVDHFISLGYYRFY